MALPFPRHKYNLIWLDMEMSGLEVDFRRPLEIAVIVTDPHYRLQTQTLSIVIHQDEDVLRCMDNMNMKMHVPSGLRDEVRASTVTETAAEKQILDFVSQYVPPKCSPLCGNVVMKDRQFLEKYFPKLNDYLSYHSIDVDADFQRLLRFDEARARRFPRQNAHRAGPDVEEAVKMQRYLDEQFCALAPR